MSSIQGAFRASSSMWLSAIVLVGAVHLVASALEGCGPAPRPQSPSEGTRSGRAPLNGESDRAQPPGVAAPSGARQAGSSKGVPMPAHAAFLTKLEQLNDGPCRPGRKYAQERLRHPVKVAPRDGMIETQLVVRIRERCVPVWVQPPPSPVGGQTTPPPPHWEMQTLNLRTYGFPKDPDVGITDADADDPHSDKIAWSAPGPTFVMHPASRPGAEDGTQFKMRLYNRMPHDPDPHACQTNIKCNTVEPGAGVDPVTGLCKHPPSTDYNGHPPFTPAQKLGNQTVEPPNCFHGPNSTNFHFHGFHVSPQVRLDDAGHYVGQDYVGLELRPPKPAGAVMPEHGSHGEHGIVAYGHFDYLLDPLRYTQPPGTHWYHAHKHGSTALHVLNGQVGTFEVRGEFDRHLDEYFEKKGGGKLEDRLMVIQQLQERPPGLGGADQNASVLVNGQANPIVTMKKGEIQRWRFVGATMQASAALRVGFPDAAGRESPVLRQIAMDGVQFSPENYQCQPILNEPDCSLEDRKSRPFNELTDFDLSPGNRVDVLVQAPMVAGKHCMQHGVTTVLDAKAGKPILAALAEQGGESASTCGVNNGLGPLFTLVVTEDERVMKFPDAKQDYPPMATYLAPIPKARKRKTIHYEMQNRTQLKKVQFWINQTKYDPSCMNETLTIDAPEQWTLYNNSGAISHPFHIHQNPFQLLSQSDRASAKNPQGRYTHPLWRDTIALPKATGNPAPNSNPEGKKEPWGKAEVRIVAKEFTGAFVNHCHILGHEDRGMMHNTQASCADGKWATTGPVPPEAKCDAEGFCPGDCQTGKAIAAGQACSEPPRQRGDWVEAYQVSP